MPFRTSTVDHTFSYWFFFQIFIGMGFPYEGPAPLEALAEGCVFFNAKFDPPHNSKNTEFFKAKPTHRKVNKRFIIVFIRAFFVL